jgi:hypothetical protein
MADAERGRGGKGGESFFSFPARAAVENSLFLSHLTALAVAPLLRVLAGDA